MAENLQALATCGLTAVRVDGLKFRAFGPGAGFTLRGRLDAWTGSR